MLVRWQIGDASLQKQVYRGARARLGDGTIQTLASALTGEAGASAAQFRPVAYAVLRVPMMIADTGAPSREVVNHVRDSSPYIRAAAGAR